MTTKTKPAAPYTREEAINALVEYDVSRWGESERAASRKMHAKLSHGMALLSLANLSRFGRRPDNTAALDASATPRLTRQDRRDLAQGG